MSNWKLVEQSLPRSVFNRWIFGNTAYPKINLLPTPYRSAGNSPKMIVVEGARNSGKTTAISSVFASVVHNLFPFHEVGYNFEGGATISRCCDDFMAVFDVKSREKIYPTRLGFWSAGDVIPDSDFERILIQDATCDIIVCAATRTKGANGDAVWNKLKGICEQEGYQIEKIHCLYTSLLTSKLDHIIKN